MSLSGREALAESQSSPYPGSHGIVPHTECYSRVSTTIHESIVPVRSVATPGRASTQAITHFFKTRRDEAITRPGNYQEGEPDGLPSTGRAM